LRPPYSRPESTSYLFINEKYLWLFVVVFIAGHRIRRFAKQSCPVRSLNSATASILGQKSKLSNGFDSWPFGYVVECHSKLSNGFDSWPVGIGNCVSPLSRLVSQILLKSVSMTGLPDFVVKRQHGLLGLPDFVVKRQHGFLVSQILL
uniref:PWWP domain-containing protein n=1 Tax=Rodentolepis nana TaxID=102285 RepID=A0A0R3TEL7_RODNA